MEQNQGRSNNQFPIRKTLIIGSLVIAAIISLTVIQVRRKNMENEGYQKALALMKAHKYGAAFTLLMPLAENNKDLNVKLALAEAMVYCGYWPSDSLMTVLEKEQFQDKAQLKKFGELKQEYAHYSIPVEVKNLLLSVKYTDPRYIQIIDSSLAMHPHSEGLLFCKASVNTQLSDSERSALLMQILAINPRNIPARKELMRTYFKQKNFIAVQTEAVAILKSLPDDGLASVLLPAAKYQQQQDSTKAAQIPPGLNGHEFISASRS
ncbi:hypothetical protein CLV59_10240 [Chitinophaga dinghuensis]|uniref:Uncharacterized protein n=1 Tax=Chitinophaga dinghuensis TaxID=1539050 RepID=A0A327W4A0_9BACT|nr:hypothetical protein [Chitinophaga dinghuensis]RAJ85339.1 hypothetical protein CLV59_10240 [Chitinophaga dinghuensis]